MMKNIRILKIILIAFRVILILGAIFLVAFLFYKDFVPSGVLVVDNSIEKHSAFFSEFYPQTYIQKKECNQKGECWQTMINTPLYFDITIPRRFETAKVIITYQDSENNLFQISLREKNRKWGFQLKTLGEINNELLVAEENKTDWQTAEVDFIISPNYVIDGKLKFMLLTSNMDMTRREIRIKEIRVILYREPMTRENFFPQFKNYLTRLLGREEVD